jgi:hypothetical protein
LICIKPPDGSIALIYAQVPRITCKGKCQNSCGPIDASPREREYFESESGRPFPDPGSLLRAGLKGRSLDCPYLNPLGRCDVYQFRPLICRLWGVAAGMPCPFGCVPETTLTDSQAKYLLKQVR